jgi:hypothetical protein
MPVTGLTAERTDAAIASARAALDLDASELARTWPVVRMHPGASGYLLVVFGRPDRACAIAAVNPDSAEVLESAHLPARASHEPMAADDAIRRAGMGADTKACLAWDPSPASRSRLYPLWHLHGADGHAWVDSIRGEVWRSLDTPRRGG